MNPSFEMIAAALAYRMAETVEGYLRCKAAFMAIHKPEAHAQAAEDWRNKFLEVAESPQSNESVQAMLADLLARSAINRAAHEDLPS